VALALALVAAAVVAVALALRDGGGDMRDGPGATLVDGSTAQSAPAVLGLGDEAVLARVRVVPRGAAPADFGSCLRLLGAAEPVDTALVETVGLTGRSVTFRIDGGRGLAACEASAHAREPRAGPWCGTSYGRLHDGRLRDGRLDVANCLDAGRRPVAFAWIEPAPRARWLVVRGGETTEAYPVVGNLPLRVTTKDVRADEAAAVFDVAHLARDGTRLTGGSVVMRVAG
jgi:hypothetical protein